MQRKPSSRSPTPTRPEVAQVSPSVAYYRLTLEDSLVGFATMSIDTSAAGIDVVEQLDLRLPDGDSVRHIVQRTSSRYTRRFGFIGLEVARRDAASRWTISGQPVTDSAFAWRLDRGAMSVSDTLATRRPLSSTASLATFVLRNQPLAVGQARTVRVADPLRRMVIAVEVRVDRDSTIIVADSAAYDPAMRQWVAARWDTLHALHITRRGSAPPMTTWVDEDGLPVFGEVLPGLMVERIPFEMATSEYRAANERGFPGVAGGVAHRTLSSAPPVLAGQRVLLPGLLRDTIGWQRAGIAGGTQSRSHDTVTVTRQPGDTSRSPMEGRNGFSAPSAFSTLSARIVSGESDPGRKATRLLAWTHNQVTASPDSGSIDPYQTLQLRRGNAAGRAAVLDGLARAAGLESRLASGLVALRDGSWARHTWVEIWLGGWVPADPLFGTFPAGAGYLRLMPGAPADPLYLVPLAGSLDPETLSPQGVR